VRSLNFEDYVKLKTLLNIESIGPRKILNLLSQLHSFEYVFNSAQSSLVKVDGISDHLAKRIIQARKKIPEYKQSAEKELNRLEKLNAKVITFWDSYYPKLLKNIYSPPLILYVLGEFQEEDKYCLSIVGTRRPTNYGKTYAEKFAFDLASQNITVVSGMARGIDSTAHRGALKAGGRTIAIIGSGLDVIYPSENRKLFQQIAENGLVISEFELGTKPDAQNFPQRNRIIAGLTLGTVIIETNLNGGAMQTAAHALDQNREVFAVPGNLGIPQSEGNNLLIQKGEAKLVKSTEDILVELDLKLKPVIGDSIPKPDVELNLFEEKILQNLDTEAIHVDKLAELTSLSVSDCLVHLLSLEFKGVVKQLPGKMFAAV
jgi:DNA processing protein